MSNTIFILLLTYFLKGGLVLTTNIVAHSQLDCTVAIPLLVQVETDRGFVTVVGKKYTIDSVDAQCIRVPAANTI